MAELASGVSLAGIAQHLNDDDVPMAAGGVAWTKCKIQRVLSGQDAQRIKADA